MKLLTLIILFSASASSFSNAYDWMSISKVQSVEATYMPETVTFTTDEGNSFICKNKWLRYSGKETTREENVKAVYSGLLAALYSQKDVRIYGKDDCSIQYIHFLNQ